jgi:hypothetical protein
MLYFVSLVIVTEEIAWSYGRYVWWMHLGETLKSILRISDIDSQLPYSFLTCTQ